MLTGSGVWGHGVRVRGEGGGGGTGALLSTHAIGPPDGPDTCAVWPNCETWLSSQGSILEEKTFRGKERMFFLQSRCDIRLCVCVCVCVWFSEGQYGVLCHLSICTAVHPKMPSVPKCSEGPGVNTYYLFPLGDGRPSRSWCPVKEQAISMPQILE